MELRVVGILVILYAVVSDDVGDWAAVDCKQQRAKHRPLRDAHVDTALCPPIQVLLPLSVSELELLCNRVVQSQALEGHDTLGNTPFQISIAPGTLRAPPMAVRLSADLRPSADGSAVCTPLMAGRG